MESQDPSNQNFWDFKISDEDDEHKSMTIFDVEFEILLFDRGGEAKYGGASREGTFGFAQWGLKCTSQRMEIPQNLQNLTMDCDDVG